MEYGNNRNWNNICFGNGLFFTAADNSDVGAYSEDGRTWTQFTIPMPSDWKALGFCDDTFIAITRYGTVLYSPDLSNWKKVATRYDTSNVVGMAYGDGAIVVMGLSESAMRAEWKTPIIKLLDEINVRTANIVRTANVYAAAEVI